MRDKIGFSLRMLGVEEIALVQEETFDIDRDWKNISSFIIIYLFIVFTYKIETNLYIK